MEDGVWYEPVPGTLHYLVGDDGSVLSASRRDGTWLRLSQHVHCVTGYLCVGLAGLDGYRATEYVHRLVLTAFRGDCPDGYESRHLNGNRTDNRLVNLAWGTRLQNAQDRAAHGTQRREWKTILSESDVWDILKRRLAGESSAKLGAEFGVKPITISSIFNGRHWKRVSDKFFATVNEQPRA